MSQPVEFLSTVGRIVWGHPMKSVIKKDARTKQPILRDGKEVEQWVFGLAIDKNAFGQNEWPNMHKAASQVYPNGVPNGFSWKYKDGDSVDRQGKPYSNREGYAGCYVLTVSTEAFAPQVYKRESNGSFRLMEPHEVKCGDYVRVMLNVKANAPTDPTHTPGIYVNPKGIEFVGYGPEIINGGLDPDEAFGAPVAQLPPGASLTPIGSSAPMPGAFSPNPGQQQPQPGNFTPPGMNPPAAAQPGQMPGGMPNQQPAPMQQPPLPQAAPQQQPGQMPPPAHDFVHNATGQMPGGMPGNGNAANPATYQQPPATQPGGHGAAPATSYPSNTPPGMPQGIPQR